MFLVLAILCAMAVVAGAVLVVAALSGAIPSRGRRALKATGHRSRVAAEVRSVERRTWLTAAGGVLLGVILTYVLHWPVLLLIVPAAAIGLPRLLSEPPQDEIKLLEALDRWVRGMLAQLSTGKSITDVLRLSSRQATPLLAPRLTLLARRLDDRWTAPQALLAMADELNSADADAVLAALILSASRGGTGASVTLAALADSLQERLRALREIETERSKPRVVVRQVVLITVLALVGFMLLSPAFFAPYGTPVGQAILLALLAAYVGSIAAMRRMTAPRRRERILRPLS